MYYFLSYVIESATGNVFRSAALTEHPFDWIERWNSGHENNQYIPIFYEEITEDRYNKLMEVTFKDFSEEQLR